MTAAFPTKAAIVGMISAAMGLKRGDPRIYSINNALRVAFRADKPGSILNDFNSIHSNEDYLVNADGVKRTGKVNTLISHKYYLQDSRFAVFLQGEDDLLEEIYNALNHPVWILYLGRKSCPLSEPLNPTWESTDNLYEAIRSFSEEDKKKASSRVLVEMDYTGADNGSRLRRVYSRRDNVCENAGSTGRSFADRKVCSFYIDAR